MKHYTILRHHNLSYINKTILIILSYWLIASSVFSYEKPRIDFSHYTTEQGLAHNSGNCFAQDDRGFLWIGCNGGLEKFDGYKFTIYKPVSGDLNSLSGIIVWALYVDQLNNLWIGSMGGGLNKYIRDRDEFISYRHNPDSLNSISSDNISRIFEDLSGRLWIATKGGGLNQFDRETEEFIHFKNDPTNPNSLKNNVIHDYCVDRSGLIWLGTENGITIFDPQTNTCRPYYQTPGDLNRFDGNAIMSLLQSHSGIIWIGTWRQGLFKFNINKNRITKYSYDRNDPNSIVGQDNYEIFEDSFGNIWITTERGLHKYRAETDSFINYSADPNDPKSLSDNFVRTIFEDQTGVIWLGTNNGGINKFDLHRKKFNHYTYQLNDPTSLSNSHVFSIHEDQNGMIWIATREGVNVYNKKSNRFFCYRHDPDNTNSLSHNSVMIVTSKHPSEIWIGSDRGISKLNPNIGSFDHYQYDPNKSNTLSNNNVRVIHIDQSGRLWIGSWGGGLDKFEPDKNKFTNYPIDSVNITHNAVVTILEDNKGLIWLGTYGKGLAKFNPITEKTVFYGADPDNPEKLQDNVINTLYQDSHGKIFVGTAGGGLSEFDPEKETFKTYDVKDGLPSSEITGILEDDHNKLWISTGKGISCFNRFKQSFTNYDIDDGLQAYVFYPNSCCKSRTGEMYFGGINGFNVFIPDNIKANPYIPQMTISDFQILNKSIKIGEKINGRIILDKSISETKKIILSYKEYVFSIEFAALHFACPMKNKYVYMLENFDEDWIETDATRRFVSYTTLKPGKYEFKVKGSNNDGKWNSEPVSMKIIVLPPFWHTWLFQIGVIFVILVTAIGIHNYRIRFIETRRKNLEIQVTERTAELKQSNEELEAFTYSVSHDLRAPLRGLDGFSQILLEDYSDKIDEKGKDYLQRIRKASHYMGQVIDDLLKLSRLTRSDIHLKIFDIGLLVESIAKEFQQTNPERKVEFIIEKNLNINGDKTLLEIMLRNLIDNAWKFTTDKTGAKIEFGLIQDKDKKIFFLKDNGIGFDMEYVDKLFEAFQRQHSKFEGTGIGLTTVQRIVSRHSGRIWAEGKENEGATFYFTLEK